MDWKCNVHTLLLLDLCQRDRMLLLMRMGGHDDVQPILLVLRLVLHDGRQHLVLGAEVVLLLVKLLVALLLLLLQDFHLQSGGVGVGMSAFCMG